MIRKGQCIKGSKVLVLGITFKENCPDVRNTKVVDIIAALKEFDLEVDVYDPWASPEEVRKVYGLEMKNTLRKIRGGGIGCCSSGIPVFAIEGVV